MNDRVRLQVAAACSAVLHVALLVALVYAPHRGTGLLKSGDEPLIVRLQPPAPATRPQTPRRLVAPGAPATKPVHSTDLISTRNSNASDMSHRKSGYDAPAVAKIGDFDSPGGGRPRRSARKPASPRMRRIARETKRKLAPATHPISRSPKKPAAKPKAILMARKNEPSDMKTAARKKTVQHTFKIAQAKLPAPVLAPPVAPELSQGRVQGGVKNLGFIGFEAERNQFAPYLEEVKRRVEKRWRTTLQLTYSGVSETQAVVDCAISPQGKLISVQIVDPGDSVSYAPLCCEAIRKAAPFPPFPFSVPDAYRSKNLEIRWTFSFL